MRPLCLFALRSAVAAAADVAAFSTTVPPGPGTAPARGEPDAAAAEPGAPLLNSSLHVEGTCEARSMGRGSTSAPTVIALVCCARRGNAVCVWGWGRAAAALAV